MKWLWRSLLPLLLVACFASFVTACKSRTPELTGKWSGNSDLSTQMARAPGSLQMQNAKAVPVQVTMTLNQNGGGVTGDAAVVISGKPEIHLPITAGVVGQDGKVSIEADRSGFSNVHLTFSGNVAAGQLSGDIALKMDSENDLLRMRVADNIGNAGDEQIMRMMTMQHIVVSVPMQTPLVFRAILGLLMDLAIPASLGAFVMAGMRLRSEGGMNFEAGGGFLKWLFWGCLLISLPGVSLWLSNEGVPGASQLTIAGATGAPYTQGVEKVTNDFVKSFLVAHVVPVVAASLVFKATRAEYCKKESARYAARAKRAQNKIERTESMVLYYLASHDLKKVESHEFTLKRNKNSQDSVVITQPDNIPDDLRRFEARIDGPPLARRDQCIAQNAGRTAHNFRQI